MKPKLFAPLDNLKKPSGNDFYDHCQVGHDTHQTLLIHRDIQGTIVDYEIYDWREYFITVDGNETVSEHGKYCTGQDIISYCIDRQGVWEAEETATILDILSEDHGTNNDVVLDFGSHIGYYSMLAALKGYRVASFDGSKENLELLQRSAVVNEVADRVFPYLCWLDDQAPILQPDQESVQLVKVDVEGAENHALQVISQLIGQHKIKYAIFEISPTFNDTYPALVETIAKFGYDVYQIPNASFEFRDEFMAAPIATIKQYCAVPEEGRREYVASLHQENFLFVRRDG